MWPKRICRIRGSVASTSPNNGVGHNYNAMQVEMNHRGRNGITFNSHLTWAKDLGYSDVSSFYGQQITNRFDRSYDYGNTAYIPRHRWVTTFNWELPVGRGKPLLRNIPRALELSAGGWRASGIVTLSSAIGSRRLTAAIIPSPESTRRAPAAGVTASRTATFRWTSGTGARGST
jgi:hypothetical protein